MATVAATTPTHLLTDVVNTQRPTYTPGSAGGVAPAYSAHLTGVTARVQPEVGQEYDQYGRLHTVARAKVFVAGGRDIITLDRVVFGTHIYEIESVKDNQSAGVLVRLDCREVKP